MAGKSVFRLYEKSHHLRLLSTHDGSVQRNIRSRLFDVVANFFFQISDLMYLLCLIYFGVLS